MPVELNIEDDRWKAADLAGLTERAFDATLGHLGYDPALWEVSVLGCDDARIAELNATFRSKTSATNVLSWPAEDRSPQVAGTHPAPPEGDGELGDIAIAYETCAREARDQNRELGNHILHLQVHGLLHLLGYDHERDLDATLMESLEIEILRDLGVPNPYI